jgi:sugar phosphate isomerase/epimerase
VSRPVTLFTGQWADLPVAELARKANEWGLGGLELASWGDRFDAAAFVRRGDFSASQSSFDVAFARESHDE